jgi:tetratricopeptide (TPR) repeat protein
VQQAEITAVAFGIVARHRIAASGQTPFWLASPFAFRKGRFAASPPSTAPFVSFRVLLGFSTAALRISAFCFLLLTFLCSGCTKEAKKIRYLANANRDFAAGQFEKAEIEYRGVLQVDPGNATAISQLGVIYHEQGRFPEALAYLKKGAELTPDNSDLRLKLCLTEFSLGGLKDARQNAELVLEKQPGQEDALLVLAETTFSTTNIQDTIQQITKLRQQDKDRPGYHLALAALYLRQGQITHVEPELNQALALDPKLPATRMALGNLYWMRNDTNRADATFKAGVELSPQSFPRRMKYADFKYKTGSVYDARKILEDITRNAPDYLPAWNYLAQLAFSQNRLDDCSAILQKVLAKDSINSEAVLLDATVKLSKNQVPEAITELQRLAGVFTHAPGIQLRLAQAFALNGDDAKAEACLRQALTFDPGSSDAIIALANLSIKRGDAVSAALSLESLVKRRPDLAQAHLLLAAAYASQNNLDQALAVYRRMQPLFPKSPLIPLSIATILAGQNHREEARKACSESLALAPDFLPPLGQLVDLDLADKQPQAALDRVQKQIERRPAVPELQLLLARICLNQKDYTQAEAAVLKAIEIAPDLQTSYMMLARMYISSHKTQQALDKLNGLVARRTNAAPALLQIGIIQESLTNYSAARDAYERVLNLNTNFAVALNNLAYLYCEHFNQIDKAAQLAEQAHRLYPTDYAMADTLGWILYRKADYPRALSALTQATAAAPNEPEGQCHLGLVCYALGQEGPARLAFERAFQGDKDFPAKDEARRRVAILTIDPKSADPATQSLLEKRVAEDPNDAIALVRLAGIFNRNGTPDKAIKAYEQALARNPKNAYVLTSLARLYSAAGSLNNPRKTLEYAKEAHAAAPDDASISQFLGHLVCQAGDYELASSLLQDAALKLPDQPALLFDLARSYYGLGQLPSAETALQNALKGPTAFDQSEEAKRFLSLLVAYRDPTQRQTVVPQLEAILKADPNYIPALMVNELLQQEKGNFQDARKTLEQVLVINAGFVPATRDLAILCFDYFPDEFRTFNLAAKAHASFPDDPNLARVLGVLTYRRKEYPAAVSLLKQSLQTRNNDAELLYYLGMTQYHLMSNTESKQSLKRALDLNVTPQLAAEAKRILAELEKSR